MKTKRVLFSFLVLAIAFLMFACSKKKTITFETNGGSSVAEITAKAGASITKPQDPTKENLTFGGWYSDVDLLDAFTFPEKMPEESITLYAKWVVTLTFDTQGGPNVDPIVGEGGKTFTLPADPVREGYVFVGWFTDKGTYKNQLTFVMPKVNTTVYARWQVFETGSAINVPLKFNDNDGVFQLSEEQGGVKITSSAAKGEWSYCVAQIAYPTVNNTTVVVELVGTKGAKVTLKVEGGGHATEETFEMTGEAQTCIWSASSDKLNENAGSMFLVFLNGGTAGCGETPEYVIIKSVKLYRTVEADATQKAAIYFNTNGGSAVAELYQEPGTAVAAPADPEKPGYDFAGWFADADFTTPFVFDKMPAEGALVYAKWEKKEATKPDIDIFGEPVVDGETYEVNYSENELIVNKNSSAGEWSWIGFDFPEGVDLAGYEYLRVSFEGPEGKQVLFKVNDTVEFWVNCTGEPQTLEFKFDLVMDTNKKALIVFVEPGVAGASDTFAFYALQFGVKQSLFDVLTGAWEALGEDPATKVTVGENTLTIKKDPKDGTEWECALVKTEDNLVDCTHLVALVEGTEGEQILFKIYDSQEYLHTCTGDVDQVIIPITAQYDPNKAALVLFANPGVLGTGNEFVFTLLIFGASYDTEIPEEPEEIVYLTDVATGFTGLDSVNAEYIVMISKSSESEWTYAGVRADLEGVSVNKLVGKIRGHADESFKFKVNDTREFDVNCDGSIQDFEFTFDFALDPSKLALVMFANPGAAGTDNFFEFYELKYVGDEDEIDLLFGEWFYADEDAYSIYKYARVSKPAEGNEWECALMYADYDFTGYEGLYYSLQGTPGEKILIKVNDRMETWVTVDDEGFASGIAAFDGNYDTSKAAVVLFPNGGDKGTGNLFNIFYLAFVTDPSYFDEPLPDVDLIESEYESRGIDAHAELELFKGTDNEWAYAYATVADPDYEGIDKLYVELVGEKDAQILFKVNDSFECWVTCTGEVQTLDFDLALTFDVNKPAMILFAEPGVAGTMKNFTVSKLTLAASASENTIDLLLDGRWEENDFGSYFLFKSLYLSKPESLDGWDCVLLYSDEDMTGYYGVEYFIYGTAGEKLLLKVNDRMETWVTIGEDGTAQGIATFDGDYDATKAAIVIFPNPGEKGTAHEFQIPVLYFLAEKPEA